MGRRTKKLKRADCELLPLVLKGEWYDMIDSGEKTEEYREMKDFWVTRICRWINRCMAGNQVPVIAFSRGYRSPDMFFISGGICDRRMSMHKDWGEPDALHFVLGLSERVELED